MLDFVNKYIFGTAVPLMLVLAGLYYTFLLRGFHIRHPITLFRSITKKQNKTGVSPFRALTLALAGTLGVGNIVGVSAAISLGGFGAVFWMWISAFCAMILKYAEIVLAMRHRSFEPDGTPHGSAMNYIKDYFTSIGLKRIGFTVALIFAFLCILNSVSMGSMIQVNAISSAFESIIGIPHVITGGCIALLSTTITFCGSESISKLTQRLVPIMTVGYVILSVSVMIIKYDSLGNAFVRIFESAFSFDSALGGVTGFILSKSLRYGVMRGLVSNEAGCGTAPCAHATSNTKIPAEQGILGIVEVFVDTILLCTMTALVVIISYPDVMHLNGNFIMMTVCAYSAVLGKWAEYFLAISVLCFAFATILCWAHYGMESAIYIKQGDKSKKVFLVLYNFSVFLGAIFSPKFIWDVADLAIGAMTLINITVICLMSREVKAESEKYIKRAE